MRVLIISVGLLVTGLWFGVCVVIWQDGSAIWLTALPAGLVASTLIAIYLHLPQVQHERQSHITDTEYLKTQAHHLRQERIPSRPGLISGQQPTDIHTTAWRHFLIRCTVESIRVGKLNYRNGMEEFFNSDQRKWREYIDRLVRWEKCWPPNNNGTFWKPNVMGEDVINLLAAGQMPPALPDYDPPELIPTQHASVDNTQNTGETRDQHASTVFATDVRER